MKESIGNAFILNLVIIFVSLFTIFFATSISYTKAFKVKNRIISILEKYDTGVESGTLNKLNNNVKAEIDSSLSEMGYRISKKSGCPDRLGTIIYNSNESDYRYCVYKHDTGDRGTYYGVAAYMYFEIPVVNVTLEFPVYGETKTMGLLD